MESNVRTPMSPDRSWNLAATAMIAATIIAALKLNIAPALIVGLGIFLWGRWMLRLLDRGRGRWVARPLVMMMTVLIVLALGFLAQFGVQRGLEYFIHQGPGLLTQLQSLVDELRAYLPAALGSALPTDIENLKAIALTALRDHAGSLATLGREGVHAAFQLMLALIIALAAALATRNASSGTSGPLTRALAGRGEDFLTCFKALLGAQVYIAFANTTFTIIYLYGILPRFDVVLPFRELVCVLTFGLGLLPVVGNLIANTLLTAIALSHSVLVAVASLTYLVVIHKLEYFINARIVGQKIHASVWELVCAMLLMEAIFGIAGLVLAPVFYAFIKMQLKLVRWL
jgi:predicted PurR-regulated permease PerM